MGSSLRYLFISPLDPADSQARRGTTTYGAYAQPARKIASGRQHMELMPSQLARSPRDDNIWNLRPASSQDRLRTTKRQF